MNAKCGDITIYRERGKYGFAGAIGADDEGERLEEGDDVLVLRIEAPDAFDQHLVHRAHFVLLFSLRLLRKSRPLYILLWGLES